jgi:hypothetical protein
VKQVFALSLISLFGLAADTAPFRAVPAEAQARVASSPTGMNGKWATTNTVRTRRGRCQPASKFGGNFGPQEPLLQLPVIREEFCSEAIYFVLDLKVNSRTGKLTGNLTDPDVMAKFKIEDGQVTGSKLQFRTSMKSGGVKSQIVYDGELDDSQTLRLSRTISGKPIDVQPDGVPRILLFARAK